MKNAVVTISELDPINDVPFIGIIQKDGLFIAVGSTFRKQFRTLEGAKKCMSKYGYNC